MLFIQLFLLNRSKRKNKMNMEEKLQVVVSQTETDAGIWHTIVHGNDETTTLTENGAVPSVAKQLKDIREAITGGVLDVVKAAENARDATLQLKNEASILKDETQNLCNETENFKDLAQNTYNLIALETSNSIGQLQTQTEKQINNIVLKGTEEIGKVNTAGIEHTAAAKAQAERAKSFADDAEAQLCPIYLNKVNIEDEIILEKKKSIYVKELTGTEWNPRIVMQNINTNYTITFELYVLMKEITPINWNTNLNFTWLSEDEADLSETKQYLLVLRSDDGGKSWFGNVQGFLPLSSTPESEA